VQCLQSFLHWTLNHTTLICLGCPYLLLQILNLLMRSGWKPNKGKPKKGGFTEQLQVLDAEVDFT